MATGTVLVLNTQDVDPFFWDLFRPSTFSCTFTEDTVISYLDIRDANLNTIHRILNVESGVQYDVKVDRPIGQLYFVPDALLTEKKLSISNITFDNVNIINKVDSAGSGMFGVPGLFVLSDGTPADNVCYSGITIEDGIMYGFTGLVPNSMFLFRVILKERVIGYVTSNTTTTVTTSLITYTNTTPTVYCFSPNVGRMPLAFAGMQESLYPQVIKSLHRAAMRQVTAPPLPCLFSASIVEHMSSTAVYEAAAANKHRLGLLKQLY